MKVMLTEAEFKKVHDYAEFLGLNPSPCYDCHARQGVMCDGCNEKMRWENRRAELLLPDELRNMEAVKDYIDGVRAYKYHRSAELRHAEEADKASKKMGIALMEIEIEQ